MTGKFMITLHYLREIGACAEGRSEFEKHFPEGGEYQEVLDKCAEEGRMDFATWLLHKIGPTDDVRTYEDQVNDKNMSICFAGTLVFEKGAIVKSIEAGRGIKAGRGIEAGCGIKAGWGIEAGRGIKAGWGIEAGEGIEAGRGIKAGRGIEAGCGIKAGRGIEAGCGIKAGWGIEAGCGIKAGWGIEAGWGIKAGDGYGIFAGIGIKIKDWSCFAKVSAQSRPKNLISGHWEEKSDTRDSDQD